MKKFLYILLLTSLISCNFWKNTNSNTYFGGEIVNPKSKFVLLIKDEVVLDSITLDKSNRFLGTYESFKEGLYTFKHGNEFQYIYLEPKDSVLVRLNTWDFDESLVFSGKGSHKNEFLLNIFLQNEKEEIGMFQNFHLNESEFEYKIDSLSEVRDGIYKEFANSERNISNGFEKLTQTALRYPLYRLKEIYPYYNKIANDLDRFPTISEDFYKFRKKINFNEENLVSFYPYQNYIVSYLYNIGYQQKEQDSSKSNLTSNILIETSKHIELESFKNNLLKRIIINDFLKSETTCKINEKALDIFLQNCTEDIYITQVKNLVNDSKVVENNKPLTNFTISTYNNIESSINELIKNKKTVIYFWSTEFMSSEYLTKRIKFLETAHPTILFIGINMKTKNNNFEIDRNFKILDITKQYRLPPNSAAHSFLTSNYPRTIMVQKNGIVLNGFTYLDSKKFNAELLKLE